MKQQFFVKNSPVSLTQQDFRAAGGEGSVYVVGKTAYKIYTDPKKMIPLGKIQELSVLSSPKIIKPDEVIYDSKGAAVGYTMQCVPDSYALCELFTKSFRQRENVSMDMSMKLIEELQHGVEFVHKNGILIVDLNELNFMVRKNFKELFFIDVDSYQTKNFPATAIMDSIRDRHAKKFDTNTDWFSFAIISFQMFCGIHPFKGKHAIYKTLDERMLNNISVFNKDVSIPAAAYPTSIIPDIYRQWYKAIFEKGQRCSPPDLHGAVIIVQPIVSHIGGSNNFSITEMYTLSGDILYFFENISVTTSGLFYLDRNTLSLNSPVKVGVLPKSRQPVVAKIEDGKLVLMHVMKKTPIEINTLAEEIMHIDGRIYIKQGERIMQIEFIELDNKVLATPKVVGKVLPNAVKVFDGVAIQSLLEADYVSIFAKPGACHQLKIDELKGYRVVDARYESKVLIIIAEKRGKYDRLIFRFDDTFTKYDLRKTEDISSNNINFTVLDNGMVLSMLDTDELELFRNTVGLSGVKIIADSAIDSSCRLMKYGQQAIFAKGNQLFKFNMK